MDRYGQEGLLPGTEKRSSWVVLQLLLLLAFFFIIQVPNAQSAVVPIYVTPTSNSTISSALGSFVLGGLNSVEVAPGIYPNENIRTIVAQSGQLQLLDEGQVIIRGLGIGHENSTCVWLQLQERANFTVLGPGELVIEGCGIVLQGKSILTQQAALTITNTTNGVTVYGSAVWKQTGEVHVTSSPTARTSDVLVTVDPSAHWDQSAPVTITSTGAVAVSIKNANWTQRDRARFQLTNQSIGVRLNQVGVWKQEETGQLEVTCSNATGVAFQDANSTWTQMGPANFTSNNGIAVNFQAQGQWIQHGTTAFQIADQGTGVTLYKEGTWQQFGSLDMNISYGRGVLFIAGGGWTQLPNSSRPFAPKTSFSCRGDGAAVQFNDGGEWIAQFALNLDLDNCYGVVNYGGEWQTVGDDIDVNVTTNAKSVVMLGNGAEWEQNANMIIRAPTQGPSTADTAASVEFYGCNASFPCTWRQKNTFEVQGTSRGVALSTEGTWEQGGRVQITSDRQAVVVSQGATWVQKNQAILHVGTNAQPLLSTGVGVNMTGGTWTSTSASNTSIVGINSVGVYLDSGTIQQDGRLDIIILGSATLPKSSCAGVAFRKPSPIEPQRFAQVWKQNQTTTIRVTDGSGVNLDRLAQWQQSGPMIITIQGNATGLDMSKGGSWYQRSSLVVNTVAEGSSSALTTGFVCGQSSTCCAQVQNTEGISFSAAGNAAARDDCPRASPSSTPAVVAPSLVVNTTATFSNSTPSVSVGGSTPSSDTTHNQNSTNNGQADVGVTLSLANVIIPAGGGGSNSSVTPETYTVRQLNGTAASNNATTWIYEAPLGNATSFAQTFIFNRQASTASFAGTQFAVSAGSVKWSLNFTSASSSDTNSTSSSSNAGFTLQYDLVALLSQAATTANSSSAAAGGGGVEVIRKSDTPKRDMTTYLVRLATTNDTSSTSGSSAGQAVGVVVAVEVFDVALVDGLFARLAHNLVLVNVTTAEGDGNSTTTMKKTQSQLRLELELPAFKQSLEYDPSLSLGVLLSGQTRASNGGGSGDDNTALIVATAVVIPVAVALVVAVVLVASLVWWRRSRARRSDLDLEHAMALHAQDDDADAL